jgi:Domain of unknown function (DUF4372)/Transposase DDE domain
VHTGRLVFAQLMDFLPLAAFRRSVARYQGEYKVRGFSCLDQFLCLGFAQLTYRESLRDIETCLRAMQPTLYHMGIRGRVARSTLADANETRDWRIIADFAHVLIRIARPLYATEPFGVELAGTVYAFDSTTIDLCLALFPVGPLSPDQGRDQAPYAAQPAREHPGVPLCLRGETPRRQRARSPAPHGGGLLCPRPRLPRLRPALPVPAGRGLLRHAGQGQSAVRPALLPSGRQDHGARCDQTIVLTGPKTATLYPLPLRRIRYTDPDTGKRLVFLTNNVTLPALTIAQLYKARWQVELFFKWIKQHLRIKAFYGTSANAVKTQVWVAVSVYVLVAIVKKRLGLPQSLYAILQVLSVTLFEKVPIYQALALMPDTIPEGDVCNQLSLFDR